MTTFKPSLMVAAIAGLSAFAAAAPNPVGQWSGRVHLTMPANLPPNVTPQQKQQLAQRIAMISQMKISLALKGDHSFTSSAAGASGPAAKKQMQDGKWSVGAGTVTLTVSGHSQVFKMAPDGKTLVLEQSNPSGGSLKVVFTRS